MAGGENEQCYIKITKDKPSTENECDLVIKHCTASYSGTLIPFSPYKEDISPNKSKQLVSKVTLQKKVYTLIFLLFFLYGFYNQVWFQDEKKTA